MRNLAAEIICNFLCSCVFCASVARDDESFDPRQSRGKNMKGIFSICAASLYLATTSAAAPTPDAGAGSVQVRAPFPLQLEMRVPIDPTAFLSAGRTYLAYELYLTNFSPGPITLRRIEVLDADETVARPIAAFEDGQMDALLQPVGAQTPSGEANLRQL